MRSWTTRALVLALVAPLAIAEAAPLSVDCERGPGGVRTLVVETDGARLDVREADALILIEADDPGEGLAGGALECAPALSVQVVPGALMGTGSTRIVVALGTERPSIVASGSRVRLLWLPRGARRAGEPARAEREPAPAAPREAETAEREPEPEQRASGPSAVAAPAEPAWSPRPDGAMPADRGAAPAPETPRGLPADFLALERPIDMVAVMDTELRLGAGRRFTAAGRLRAGERVTVDGRAGDWLRAVSGAWVFGPYMEAPDEALDGGGFAARVAAINAPVHSGPAAHHEIVAELYRGDRVVIDDVAEEWAHVRDGGWVKLSDVTRQDTGKD